MKPKLFPIPGHEGRYSATKCGNIFSHLSDKFLKPYTDNRGYHTCSIQLSNGILLGKQNYHWLIAATFLGPRPDGFEIDHINRIRSDNRIENLRYVPRSVNTHNKGRQPSQGTAEKVSRFKGVIWRKHRSHCKAWTACLRFNGKRLYLPYFKTEEEAARAYDAKVIELRGELACTNEKLGYFK